MQSVRFRYHQGHFQTRIAPRFWCMLLYVSVTHSNPPPYFTPMKTTLMILPLALMATLVEAKQDDFDRLVAEERASSFEKAEAARDSRGTVLDTAAAEAVTQQDSAAAAARVAQDTALADRATHEDARGTVQDTAAVDAATQRDTAAAEARLKRD